MSVVMLNYELERIFKYLESEVEGEKRRGAKRRAGYTPALTKF